MPVNVKKIIYFFNAFAPLAVGLIIYLKMKQSSYISQFVLQYIEVIEYVPKTILGVTARNWGCDFFWAYSLNSVLFYFLRPFKHKAFIAFGLTALLGVILELLQLYGALSGTFDVLDMIFEIIGAVISGIVSKIILKEG